MKVMQLVSLVSIAPDFKRLAFESQVGHYICCELLQIMGQCQLEHEGFGFGEVAPLM